MIGGQLLADLKVAGKMLHRDRNEHRTPGEADTFAQMLVDAKHG